MSEPGFCEHDDLPRSCPHCEVAALTAQLAEAVSAKDFHAARAQRLQAQVIAAQAEVTALREALAKGLAMLAHAERACDNDNTDAASDYVRSAMRTLGGQPPTGGQ